MLVLDERGTASSCPCCFGFVVATVFGDDLEYGVSEVFENVTVGSQSRELCLPPPSVDREKPCCSGMGVVSSRGWGAGVEVSGRLMTSDWSASTSMSA